jgi:predicted site-specific integrase-resolvase
MSEIQYYTTKQVSDQLGINYQTLMWQIKKKRIKAVKLTPWSKPWMIPEDEYNRLKEIAENHQID